MRLPKPVFVFIALLPSVLLAEELALTSDDDLSVFERVATLSVCFDFGCKRRKDVHIHTPEWRGIEALLVNRPDPATERESIARAVAYMERIVGTMSPTGRDRGGNEYREDDEPGQMDCIDESTNTTAYLSLFEERGLLEWHRVMDPVYRAPQILDQHWAARIEEVATGSQFAVDSWPGDNGEPPLIQRVDAWLKKLALDGEWRR